MASCFDEEGAVGERRWSVVMYGEKADSTYEYGTLIRLVAANKWKVKFSNGGCFDVLEGQMEVLARKQNAIAELSTFVVQ